MQFVKTEVRKNHFYFYYQDGILKGLIELVLKL